MNLHLATAATRRNGALTGMTMLYKVASGVVKDDHYGIALAKMMGLPPRFIAFAEHVAADMQRKREAAKQTSEAARVVRRRKLVINLDETLRQIVGSGMDPGALWGFLRRLRDEFIDKMAAIEEEGGGEKGEEREVIEVDDDDDDDMADDDDDDMDQEMDRKA
jgi:DNA mismatch repair protein MSH4